MLVRLFLQLRCGTAHRPQSVRLLQFRGHRPSRVPLWPPRIDRPLQRFQREPPQPRSRAGRPRRRCAGGQHPPRQRQCSPDPAGKLLGSVTGLARLTEPVVDLHPHCSIGSQEPQNLGVSGSQNIHPLLPGGIIDNSRGESPENRGRTSQNQADVDAVFIVCFGPQIKQPSGTHGSGNRCLGASQSRGHFKIKLSPQAHVGTRTAHEPQHNPGRDQHRTVGEVSRNRVRFIQSVISKLAIRRQPGCAHVGFVLGFLDFAGEKLRHPRIPDVGKELPRNRQSCCGGKGTGEIHLHPALFS